MYLINYIFILFVLILKSTDFIIITLNCHVLVVFMISFVLILESRDFIMIILISDVFVWLILQLKDVVWTNLNAVMVSVLKMQGDVMTSLTVMTFQTKKSVSI